LWQIGSLGCCGFDDRRPCELFASRQLKRMPK
jgi:hypothetical protein